MTANVFDLPLWSKASKASMRVHVPNKKEGSGLLRAIVIFPGGAYETSKGSGSDAAAWLATHGIVGVQVDYGTRGTESYFPQNYSDAARAIRMVRARASEWSVDPNKIGIMGFSAGGHLASLVSTQPDLYVHAEDDLSKTVSAKSNFLILAYPVSSFMDGYHPGAYAGTVDNFFGKKNPGEGQRKSVSAEHNLKAGHGPVFIWTTQEDSIVPYTQSKLFAEACVKLGVPVQYRLYEKGPHGMGLALRSGDEVKEWTGSLLKWLNSHI